MIVVKVELWDGGDGTRAKEIGRLVIGNMSELADHSSYAVAGRMEKWDAEGQPARVASDGWVMAHDRKTGVFELIRKAIEDLKDKWRRD